MIDQLIMTTVDRDYFLKCIKTLCTGSHSDATRTAQTLQGLLQSLPMVSAEPVGYTNDSYKDTRVDGGSFFSSPTSSYVNPLYTSPQALTQITADDVTDEMLGVFLSQNRHNQKEICAAGFNAVREGLAK